MRTWTVIGYSVICAALLLLFSQIQDLLKYVFSLGALYLGIYFFRRHESRGMRIAFVATTVVLYFIFTVMYAMYLFVKQHPSGA
ncbi:hypothetical protein ACFQI7_04690 [Paenibacillus allorhizosphaerae]|uniref:Uncharacterized protein n=1 Tax=Paenibacillus allorhizosphaerae TaxID=2849866 RepID=A0ABM8VC40_9BACL|nr:hypothetical protein [Paenibacillus allorhizosphaerae]CAG7622967.1 hypothetical protein PAECIP111802_00887 [Paenibacillus allorhizosphaerae]